MGQDEISSIRAGDLVITLSVSLPGVPSPAERQRSKESKRQSWQATLVSAQDVLIGEYASSPDALVFWARGSAPEPYKIVFVREVSNLTGLCSCRGASNGHCCKHLIAVLTGRYDSLVEPDARALDELRSWYAGSDVERALLNFQTALRLNGERSDVTRHHKKALAEALKD